MEPKFQTSFIPKKQIGGESEKISIVEETNIFSLAATLVFVVTILMLGGLYGYRYLVLKQISEADAKLNEARSVIQTDKIQNLIDANSRITTGVSLLERHVITTKLLTLLNDSSIKKIKFNDFTYQNKDNTPSIIIDGEVSDYSALASQNDVLKKNELIKNPDFGDFLLSDNGFVRFHFTARLDPSLVSYKKSIESLDIEQ